MPATDESPAVTRPNLLPLLDREPETVAHITLAEIGRLAEWQREIDRWRLYPLVAAPVNHVVAGLACLRDDGEFLDFGVPRPLHDDGDAWRLMVREGLRPRRTGPTWWRVEWTSEKGRAGFTEGPDPRRQAVLAALHRNSADPRWSGIIPSLIERLENGR
jgi:hypothetical protein